MFRSNYRASVQSIYGAVDIEAYFLHSNLSAKSRLKLFFGAIIRKYTVLLAMGRSLLAAMKDTYKVTLEALLVQFLQQ